MRLNDQVAFALQELAGLLQVCPSDPSKDAAAIFEQGARVLGGIAAWLNGQAVLLRGTPCAPCAGMGNLNGETCRECGGTGKVPVKGGPT